MGDSLRVEWRAFSLEQVNSKEGPDWKLWEQPEGHPSRGLLALRAGEAARCQGAEAYEKLHFALLAARHKDKKDIASLGVLLEVAQQSGLDVARFERDLKDRAILEVIGRSHSEAVEKHRAFGVPTFVFPNGSAMYLKLYPPPEGEALSVFDALMKVMGVWRYVGEVKRPQPPWPSGLQA